MHADNIFTTKIDNKSIYCNNEILRPTGKHTKYAFCWTQIVYVCKTVESSCVQESRNPIEFRTRGRGRLH